MKKIIKCFISFFWDIQIDDLTQPFTHLFIFKVHYWHYCLTHVVHHQSTSKKKKWVMIIKNVSLWFRPLYSLSSDGSVHPDHPLLWGSWLSTSWLPGLHLTISLFIPPCFVISLRKVFVFSLSEMNNIKSVASCFEYLMFLAYH